MYILQSEGLEGNKFFWMLKYIDNLDFQQK